jgi:hypothetical protein
VCVCIIIIVFIVCERGVMMSSGSCVSAVDGGLLCVCVCVWLARKGHYCVATMYIYIYLFYGRSVNNNNEL